MSDTNASAEFTAKNPVELGMKAESTSDGVPARGAMAGNSVSLDRGIRRAWPPQHGAAESVWNGALTGRAHSDEIAGSCASSNRIRR